MTEQSSITCPVCSRTSYNPHDIRWGYCGKCKTFTSPSADARGIKLPEGDWQNNPVVTDKPIIRNGPTRPPVPTFWDWFIRTCFGVAALICLGYVLYVVVIT